MTHAAAEVLVLGGGPAGCAAASLLARWGHAVTLRTQPTSPTPLAESLPPSTGKLLDVCGVGDRFDRESFVRSTGNTVWWGSGTPRIEFFADGQRGWQVTRSRLETLLIQHAVRAGVQVVDARTDPELAAAAFVLDCTGRRGVVARARRLRVPESRHRTVALLATWRSAEPFGFPDPTHTVIESYEGGWAWSVPTAADERCVAIMVDPGKSDLPRGTRARDVYRDQLSRARHIQQGVAGATLTAGVFGWNASTYHATRYVDDNVLLVGDAGSFIDPLSSAGVKKALASGWLAAVSVHTALTRPAMRQTALDFFEARERDVYASFRRLTASFFSDAARGHTHPFWTDQAEDPPSHDTQRVAQAYDRLRAEEAFRVQRSPDVRTEPRPAVSGREIVMEPRLVSNDDVVGSRFLWDVDLPGLLDLAPAYTSVPDVFEAYNRRYPPVALPDFLRALSTLLARNWLLWL